MGKKSRNERGARIPGGAAANRSPARRAEAQQLNDSAWQLIQAGRFDMAAYTLDLADAAFPALPETANLRGILATSCGDHAAAIPFFEEAIRQVPKSAGFRASLGGALVALGDCAKAVECLRQACNLAPDLFEAQYNLGTALMNEYRFEEALPHLRRAFVLRPTHAMARYNLASSLLHHGPDRQCWECYEARWDCPSFTTPRFAVSSRQWKGVSEPTGHLMLLTEQGFGDVFLIARFIPQLLDYAHRVTVVVPPAVVPLLQASFPQVDVMSGSSTMPEHDAHLPIMSLPYALGLDRLPEPPPGAYLQPSLAASRAWQQRISAMGRTGATKVGIVWAGNPTQSRDRYRSMTLEQLGPLFGNPNVDWFSLQVGPAAAELASASRRDNFYDLSPLLTDFNETAAAIRSLDLVISTDTAVANLAGALFAPLWVLLDAKGDWRWPKRAGAPSWYRNIRVFRQLPGTGWRELIERVSVALSPEEFASELPVSPVLADGG